jgi:hypothetical protein
MNTLRPVKARGSSVPQSSNSVFEFISDTTIFQHRLLDGHGQIHQPISRRFQQLRKCLEPSASDVAASYMSTH